MTWEHSLVEPALAEPALAEPAPRRRRPGRTQAERTASTRGALLRSARELFAERGYAGTGREEIAERAGVTRGALYHHFDSKADVFAAVVEALDGELATRAVAAAEMADTPVNMLRFGARAYIDACAKPDVARIVADAPSVLGPEAYRALNAASCIALLRAVLDAAADEGVDIPGEPEIAAPLILGALNEAALLVASAPDRARAAARIKATVDAFLSRLVGG